MSPDLFWRNSPGLDMTDQSEAEWRRGMALYTAFDFNQGVADVAATINAARTMAGASGPVAVMGYCMGSLLSFLTSARHPVEATVVYHGGGIENHLAEAEVLRSPLLMHIGEFAVLLDRRRQTEAARRRLQLLRRGRRVEHTDRFTTRLAAKRVAPVQLHHPVCRLSGLQRTASIKATLQCHKRAAIERFDGRRRPLKPDLLP